MKHITTFTGEDFLPLAPKVSQIHIEDIAHALSMMTRANGHFTSFFSVAQHCINCANEAKARGLTEKVQVACLLHDASEAYLSDVTRPVKDNLPEYRVIEKHLQDMIYEKFLDSPLTADEVAAIKHIDDDMLICEFNALMSKKVFSEQPILLSKPSFALRDFHEVEKEFIRVINSEHNTDVARPQHFRDYIKETEDA